MSDEAARTMTAIIFGGMALGLVAGGLWLCESGQWGAGAIVALCGVYLGVQVYRWERSFEE